MSEELQIDDLKAGRGPAARPGQRITVHYSGWLEDGTRFDSSHERGKPFSFRLGAGNVIKGWDEGVPGMKVGGKRMLIIPPALAYGEKGSGSGKVPPNATLLFEVELIKLVN